MTTKTGREILMDLMWSNYTLYETNSEETTSNKTLEGTLNTTSLLPATTTSDIFNPSNGDLLYNYWMWTIIDGLLMIIIIGGNTLTILAVTLSRRLSSLISNQFVLNLAISDFMVGITLPYHLIFYFDENLGLIKWTCLLRIIFIMLACLASIYNLIAIAVDRYIAIVHPLHYGRYMTKAVTRLLLGATWTLAIGISIIPIFWNNWDESPRCEMNSVIPKEYTTAFLAPMFSLIWIIMLILYCRIWREASCHAKRMRTNTCSPAGPNDWKSIQVVLMVLGSFSICWMPFVVVACTQTLEVYVPHSPTVYKLTFSLAVSNSGINPIIYAWKNAGFRRAFIRLLHCKRPDSTEYNHSFRCNSPGQSDKKTQSDQGIARNTQRNYSIASTTAITDDKPSAGQISLTEIIKKDNDARINNNSFKNSNKDECHIIENATYDDSAIDDIDKCHIIENIGYEDTLGLDSDITHVKTNRAYLKESDEEIIATLTVTQTIDKRNKMLKSVQGGKT